MARKTVYGKRPNKASAFAVSTVFLSSSPAKSSSRPNTASSLADNNRSIGEAAIALENLTIRDDDPDLNDFGKHKEKTTKARRALGTRDGNSRGPRKPRDVKDEELGLYKEKVDIKGSQGVSRTKATSNSAPPSPLQRTGERPSISLHLSQSSIRPDPSCDPYITPLVSLTNDQTNPISFSDWSESLSSHFSISKIAEASYGEVYRLSLLAPHPQFTSADESVLKVLALKPSLPSEKPTKKKSKAQMNREEGMSEVDSVVSEVKLLKRMTEVPGFTNYRALHILRGRPSESFISAWKSWNTARPRGDKSTFPDPSKKASYGEDQLWAVVEMQDAGTDIEKLQEEERLGAIWDVWDVFWQVVIAIGKGEEEARFEHRDLHAGNICVRSRRKRRETEVEDMAGRKLGFTDLETTIIDYTLSRAEMPRTKRPGSSQSTSSQASSNSEDEGLEIAYLDLASASQDSLFTGDASVDYQYEMYRSMRSALYFSDPLLLFEENETFAEESGRTWKGFHPQTNLVWLHFVLHKLLDGLDMWPSEDDGTIEEGSKEKALHLETVLKRMEKMLSLESIPREGLMSARDLVAIALNEGWLDDGDVVGCAG